MCQIRCCYEDYDGDCMKPRGLPCPYDEEAVEAHERELDFQADFKFEEMRFRELEE